MEHMCRRAASRFVALIAIVLSALPAFAQTDHFKCYNATELTLEQPTLVTLSDQFVAGDEVQVVNAVWFCNPVAKAFRGQTTPVTEPQNHLTLYPFAIKETAPARRVTISNQFGEQVINVTAPRLLAVPTQKGTVPLTGTISHFKCYEAEGPALNVSVGLDDQFPGTETVRLLAPRFFCNPAVKTVGRVTTPIVPGEAHLACYKLTPSEQPAVDFVNIVNQFDRDTLKIEPSQFLCAPSRKLLCDGNPCP
jgi:hypothetical protein